MTHTESLEDTLKEHRARKQVVSADNNKRKIFLNSLGDKVLEATKVHKAVINTHIARPRKMC